MKSFIVKNKVLVALITLLALLFGAAVINNAIQDRNEERASAQEWEEWEEYYNWLDTLEPEVRQYEMTKDMFIDRRHALTFAYEVCDLLDDYYAEAVFEYMMNPRVTPGVQGTTAEDRIEAMMLTPSNLCPEHAEEVGNAVMNTIGVDMRPGR